MSSKLHKLSSIDNNLREFTTSRTVPAGMRIPMFRAEFLSNEPTDLNSGKNPFMRTHNNGDGIGANVLSRHASLKSQNHRIRYRSNDMTSTKSNHQETLILSKFSLVDKDPNTGKGDTFLCDSRVDWFDWITELITNDASPKSDAQIDHCPVID